ncbi:4-oxalocrotonate tautomerase [Pectinatus haikarae]|uniref:4-oxalocrotonate tautomerase n=2 Tax=Pectinatus haikarae TaxID=349096 RepID=A0ABT9YAS7_9FIRM|nr:4-oxalocrotonate tautomerase [Pectinatus haikarae]
MPYIQIEAGPHVSTEQKKQLIADITQDASKILGIPASGFYVLIKENYADNWGIGGRTLTDIAKKRTSDNM